MGIIPSFNNFVIPIVTFLKLANVINCAICLKNISEKKEKEEKKGSLFGDRRHVAPICCN